MKHEPEVIRQAFIRICRDSGFSIEGIEAAKLTGAVLSIHPLEVAAAFPYIKTMCDVAGGNHPIVTPHLKERDDV